MITLVTPPSTFLLDQRVFMSLGILKVGASLEQAGVAVDHLDLTGVRNYLDVVRDYMQSSPSRCFALTATTPQMPAATSIAYVIRPYAKVILGGPHPTLVNAAAKREQIPGRASKALAELLSGFDAIIAGDGERAIFRAMEETGLIDADDPKSDLWQTSADFNTAPWPARHLVDVDSYHYTIDGRRALSLVAQLGCPFACNFCGGRLSPMLRRMRRRSTENVIAEMLHLHKAYGVSAINFYDDELNVNPNLVDLMRRIKSTGIDWRLRGFVRSDLFTEEQAEAMYAAGFRWLLCGFESAHPRMLRNMNKKSTVANNTRMLHIAHQHGLKVKALMSFGHPAESEATILTTRDWLLQEKPDDFDCTIITTYPGCAYYDYARLQENGIYVFETNGDKLYAHDVNYATDAMYYKGKPGDYKSYVWTDYLSPEQLVELRDAVEAEVRDKLKIPFYADVAALQFEHSMGQGNIPAQILRGTR